MARTTKRFIAFSIDSLTITAWPTRRAAQKALNADFGRIAGVGWDETLLRVAGVEVRVSEKAERAGRELFALVFEDFPLARQAVNDAYGLDFVDWETAEWRG